MNDHKRKAQAVTELTIFGAILIFVIGSILRNAADSGMNQNQNLKAMRWALLQSLDGVRNVNKSRDAASVLFLEDRLSPEAGKFGSMDRLPLVQSASGTFSNTLFMPIDWLETQNIPISDTFINGVHFTFSGGRFMVYDIRIDPSDSSRIRIWDLTSNIITTIPRRGNWDDASICPIFYTLIPSNSVEFCPVTCSDATITMDQRFDLNRNDDYTDDVSAATRPLISWQWKVKRGLKSQMDIDVSAGRFPQLDVDGDRKEETIYEVNPDSLWEKTGSNYNVQQGAAPLVSPAVDMAALEAASGIIRVDIIDPDTGSVTGQEIVPRETVQQVYVLDYEKGDLAGNTDDTNLLASGQTTLDRGLMRSASILTQARDGTYLEINEGRAFVPSFTGTGEFVRSISKKDKIDVISRVFQLDNNTGRYCGTVTGARWATIGNEPGGLPNPVQYCVNTASFPAVNCFSPVTAGVTCFDAGTNKLFIRSRIEDTSGRKWVTRTK